MMAAKLDKELEPVDRLLARWARDKMPQGKPLHPLVAMQLMHDGAVLGSAPPGNQNELILVDQTVLKSPPRTKALLNLWYGTKTPTEVIASRIGVSRSTVYSEWSKALHYMRGALRAQGLSV